jgi:hypothetical protein
MLLPGRRRRPILFSMLRREGDLVERITSRRRARMAATTAALVALAAFGVAGGTGLAGSVAKPGTVTTPGSTTQEAGAGKATICHKKKVTIRVSVSAVPAHLAHGDVAGQCPATAGANASKADKAARKAEKAAAKAKAKAAKANAGKKQAGDDEAEDESDDD